MTWLLQDILKSKRNIKILYFVRDDLSPQILTELNSFFLLSKKNFNSLTMYVDLCLHVCPHTERGHGVPWATVMSYLQN